MTLRASHFLAIVALFGLMANAAPVLAQDRPARTEDATRGRQAQDAASRTQRDAEREGRQRRDDIEGAADSTAQETRQRSERAGAQADSTVRTARDRGERAADNAGRQDSSRTTRVDRMAMLAERMESARQREQDRHERRLARIEEIRTVAKEQNDTEALTRVDLLVEREAEVHTKKIQQLADLERRMARLRDGGEGAERPDRESRGQRDSTRSDNR